VIASRAAKGSVSAALAIITGLVAATPAYAYVDPDATALAGGGDVPAADPSILFTPPVANDYQSAYPTSTYELYATGNEAYTAPDGQIIDWVGPVTAEADQTWWNSYGNWWAPDVSYHSSDGKFWMYYAETTGTANNSAIGLAMSSTGLPGSWIDYGSPVLTSNSGSPYNAIDPHGFVRSDGSTWLTFGSFYDGINILQVDSSTGLPVSSPTVISSSGEGSDLVYANGYFYLFFSNGSWCCYGTSNYEIEVGRSTSILGPYVDENGTSLTSGGGTVVLASHDYVDGPGGSNIFHWGVSSGLEIAYHYWDMRGGVLGYDGDLGRVLGINDLEFDSNGWPYVL